MSIVSIVAREILDSRGNPTVEVDLRTEKGDQNQRSARMSAQIHHVRHLTKSIKEGVTIKTIS